MKKLPWATLLLGGAALLLFLSPSLSELFELSREGIAHGQWWRIITGHFSHWSFEHLFWDLGMFLLFGSLLEMQETDALERRNNRSLQLLKNVFLSSIVISAAVLIFQPEIQSYRGLSGLCTMLFVMFALSCLREARDSEDKLMCVGASVALLFLLSKIAFELVSSSSLFVELSALGFIVVPLAHAVGAVYALIVIRPETLPAMLR